MTALNPVMRVGEQIAEGPLVRLGHEPARGARARARADAPRRHPRPGARAGAYPHELSGGMRQRVDDRDRARPCDPKLLLCDEPTTALDVTIQDQILKLLARCASELGVSVVFVSHDLAVIAQTCQRVAVMYAGQVSRPGRSTTVFREPRHPYTLGLLRSVPDVDDVARLALESIPGAPPDLAAPPPGCRFHPRCPFVQRRLRRGRVPAARRSAAAARPRASIHDLAAEDVRRRAGDRGALSRCSRSATSRCSSRCAAGSAAAPARAAGSACCAPSTASTSSSHGARRSGSSASRAAASRRSAAASSASTTPTAGEVPLRGQRRSARARDRATRRRGSRWSSRTRTRRSTRA